MHPDAEPTFTLYDEFCARNRWPYQLLADGVAAQYPPHRQLLEERYLQRADGGCCLPLAYLLAYVYLEEEPTEGMDDPSGSPVGGPRDDGRPAHELALGPRAGRGDPPQPALLQALEFTRCFTVFLAGQGLDWRRRLSGDGRSPCGCAGVQGTCYAIGVQGRDAYGRQGASDVAAAVPHEHAGCWPHGGPRSIGLETRL